MTAQRKDWGEQAREGPTYSASCIYRLKCSLEKEIAEEILLCLRSVAVGVPEAYRSQKSPDEALGEKRGACIVRAVRRGTRFAVLRSYETESIRFTGIAAGAIQAAKAGGLNAFERTYLDDCLRGLVMLLAMKDVRVPKRVKYSAKVRAKLLGAAASGETTVRTGAGLWFQMTTSRGIHYIECFGVLPVSYPWFMSASR